MKAGDPAGFKHFFKLFKVSPGIIARYVGNRLNILFHSAGVVVLLRDVLQLFLEKYCKESRFRLAVLNDLQQPLIITQLRVLGLFGKILTGPWMSIFYKNEEKRKHIDMVPVMKLCIESISSLITNPRSLLEKRMDCFMNELDASDVILKSLRNCDCDEVFLEIVQSLAGGFQNVLERQLHNYLEGELSNFSHELSLSTDSAPLHKMHSERALGMFDANCARAKNATAGFVDGKVKFKINKTMQWLTSKDLPEHERIISFSICHAAKKRKSLCLREVEIQQAYSLKQKVTG